MSEENVRTSFTGWESIMSANIIFFRNGVTAVLRDGVQQPELQRPWAELFADFLESRGADPTTFRLQMPNGQHAQFFRTSEGRWNWKFEEDDILCPDCGELKMNCDCMPHDSLPH